jgi:integrase
MSNSVYRRCDCRDEKGKQYWAKCPQLKSDPKHGSWAYYLSHGTDPRTGQRRQFRKAGFARKGDAQTALAKLRASLDSGTYVEPSKITLGEYASQWLKRRQATGKGLKATTLSGYTRYVEADIIPSKLGTMKLTDIRRGHINQFVAELIADGRGPVAVRRILALLTTMLNTAVKGELFSANPALGADKPALADGPVKVWEPDDVRTFLMRCTRHRLGVLFEIAVLTGLRRAELCGLHRSDVDLAARKITVRWSRVSVRERVLEQAKTKTRAGLRMVSLSDAAVGALLTWQLRQAEEAEAAQGRGRPEVICSPWKTVARLTRATSPASFRSCVATAWSFRR